LGALIVGLSVLEGDLTIFSSIEPDKKYLTYILVKKFYINVASKPEALDYVDVYKKIQLEVRHELTYNRLGNSDSLSLI
jgi:hypothetical protein